MRKLQPDHATVGSGVTKGEAATGRASEPLARLQQVARRGSERRVYCPISALSTPVGRLDHQAASTCKMLLAQLREAGVIPPVPDPREDTMQRRIEDDYEAYLAHERGLASTTITNYIAIARDFLAATPKQPDSLYAT
jgi:hypothetical protein